MCTVVQGFILALTKNMNFLEWHDLLEWVRFMHKNYLFHFLTLLQIVIFYYIEDIVKLDVECNWINNCIVSLMEVNTNY